MKTTLYFLSFAGLLSMGSSIFSSNKTFNSLRNTICKKSSTMHANGVEEEIWALGFGDERQKFILPGGVNCTYDVEVIVEKPFVLKVDFQAMNEEKKQNRQAVFRKYSEQVNTSLIAGKIMMRCRNLRK